MGSVPQNGTIPTGDVTVITVMTKAEAAAAERAIIRTGNQLRTLLLEFDERRGWAALGYGSWNEWANKVAAQTFGLSRVHLLRELVAGQIETELVPIGTNSPPIPESHLRPLAPLRDEPEVLRETWQRANELAEAEGKPRIARHVKQAVQDRVACVTGNGCQLDAPDLASEPLDPFEETVLAQLDQQSESYPSDIYWRTPQIITDRVLRAIGHIDRNPCSIGDPNVPAASGYSPEDGLLLPWVGEGDDFEHARVYFAPPVDNLDVWAGRIAKAYWDAESMDILILVPAQPHAAWWRQIPASSVCFLRDDIGLPAHAAVLSVGVYPPHFAGAFQDLGTIYYANDPLES